MNIQEEMEITADLLGFTIRIIVLIALFPIWFPLFFIAGFLTKEINRYKARKIWLK